MATRSKAAQVPLDTLPGHHVRRLQQISVAVFLQETEAHGITPVQFAALQTVNQQRGIDQRTLARTIGFDTSTIAGVVDRLEARGLLRREASDADRRVRLLRITADGAALIDTVMPAVARAQTRLLAPLPKAERADFMRMLRLLVEGNNEQSRAPSDT